MRDAGRIVGFLVATVAFGIGSSASPLCAQAFGPGGLLKPRMTLVYSAGGNPSKPWIVDAVATGATFAGKPETSHIQIRKNGEGSDIEEVRLAREAGILLEYEEAHKVWRPSRPVRPGKTLEIRDQAGRLTTRYEAGAPGLEAISGRLIPVIHTTVVFFDKDGRPARRLRERYSTGLATATGGVFEVADPGAAGGYKPTLEFELVQIGSLSPAEGASAASRASRSGR